MVQSWNFSGIKAFFGVLFKKSDKPLLLPHYSYKNISLIPFEELKSKGCEIVVFDKDNTLTAPYAKKYFDNSIKETISRVQQLYGYENVLMFSNSLGTKGEVKIDEEINQNMDIKIMEHQYKKPQGFQELLELYPIHSHKMVVVGDRYLTDIYGGNRYGMLTIYVEPFTEENDNFFAKIARRLENNLVHRYRKQNIRPTDHPFV